MKKNNLFTPEKAIFRGQTKEGEWVTGYYAYIKSQHRIYPLDSKGEPFGKKYKVVIPYTVSQSIGMFTYSIDGSQTFIKGNRIFVNDIVRITLRSGTFYDYLVWHCNELPHISAVPIEKIEYNGYDFFADGRPEYPDFLLLVQDPYGDVKSVEVINNVFDTDYINKALQSHSLFIGNLFFPDEEIKENPDSFLPF